MPKRIQRRRARGWRLPEGAVIVDRSTVWGNPFVVDRRQPAARCVELFQLMIAGYLLVSRHPGIEAQQRYNKYAFWHIGELAGKDLACWCRESAPCHADILIEVANSDHTRRRDGRAHFGLLEA